MIIKAEFKNFIDLTSTVYDNKIDLIVAGVNSFVQKYCANILIKEAVTEYFDSDEILNAQLELMDYAEQTNTTAVFSSLFRKTSSDNFDDIIAL